MWIESLKWAWENKSEVLSSIKQVREWFSKSSKESGRILILGPGGVGKSTLARMLCKEFDGLINVPGEYDESLKVGSYTLEDDQSTEFIVPPGQKHRRNSTWTELLAAVAGGEYRGIIVILAYGHHSLGDISYKQHKLFESGDSKSGFLTKYSELQRADEIHVVDQIVQQLKLVTRKTWMLSVVTKEDLWWKNRDDVQQFYTSGEYGSKIRDLLSSVDERQFRHEIAFVSLLIQNFVTGRNEELQKNTAGYDQPLQINSLRHLLESIDSIREWELDT